MAASASEVGPMMAKVALECGGDISASQEDILANSSFLGAGNAPSASASASQARGGEDDEEVFATPPELPQQDPITMCSLPFTPSPSQPQSPSPPPSDEDDADKPRRKPRVCTRKVRGAKVSTPAPAPTPTPSPEQQQQPEQPPRAVDPLYRAMLMIPTATAAATTSKQDPLEDFLALARQRGIF